MWIAIHTTLGTEVAIKFVEIRGESHDALRRFEREANVVARLRSPHVVQILDYGIDEGDRPYLAMELLQGESLKDRLDRTRTLRLEEVTTVVIQTCRALHRAHKAGIVHRDIKPANLFLSEEDDSLHVKVLDFGVAKASAIVPGPSDAQKTETGAIVGTPAYMSPEQVLASEEIDGRSDLFSLGVLAWRMLVGVNPHERDGKSLGFGELLIQIATKPVPPPSQFVEGLSPEVDAWFARALAIEANSRFKNAKEMAEGLAATTNRTFAQAGTGAYAAVSGDVSGNLAIARESFHDSDDEASPPAEVELLRLGGTNSGARKIASLSDPDASGATGPGQQPQKKRGAPFVWIGAAVAVVAVALWFFFGRARPPAPVAASPVATEVAATAATPARPAVDDHAAAKSAAPPASDVTAAQAPTPPSASPPPLAAGVNAHAHAPSGRGSSSPHPPPKTGSNDAQKKPPSSNTLLDDRL